MPAPSKTLIAGYTIRRIRTPAHQATPATYRDVMRLCHQHHIDTGQYINPGQTVTRAYCNKPTRIGDYFVEPVAEPTNPIPTLKP